jgi:peptidase M1-like protein
VPLDYSERFLHHARVTSSWLRPAHVLALGAALLAGRAPAHADGGSPSTRDAYMLRARLDPERGTIAGQATIRWRNPARVELHALYLHLYANAFADGRTVFMREHGDALRGVRLLKHGAIELTRLGDTSGGDLLQGADARLLQDDATQLRVALPRALAPGASITLSIEFSVRLPTLVARMGQAGDFFMIAQWFPKLARVTSEGEWLSFPYHGLGEFDADFADYELEVDVPERFVVAAPGKLVARRASASGRRVERYRLERALDIAWAAWPRLRVVSRESADRGVRIDVYASPGLSSLAEEQAAWLEAGLASLSARLGPYPYRRLVLVLPPASAVGAAGMEYPGLIVGWITHAWLGAGNPIARAVHDDVSAHELAHQWFPITVASHEVETPMLDEGLAEWLGLDLMRARYGREFMRRAFGLPFDLFELERVRMPAVGTGSSLRPAYAYTSWQLGGLVYAQPALALESLCRIHGRARCDAALEAYAARNRFQHVGFSQLWSAFDEVYGAGFSARTLQPALEGKREGLAAPVEKPDPERKHVLAPPEPIAAPSRSWIRPQSLFARVLFVAQALLGVLGP